MWASTPARFLSMNDRPLPGQRLLKTLQNPAAGADFQFTVPGGRMWRVLGGTALFTASATVANRIPGIALNWQQSVYYVSRFQAAVAASTSCYMTFGCQLPGPVVVPAGGAVTNPLPFGWLPPATIIESFTASIQATDQWSLIAMTVEEVWITDEELTENEDEAERFFIAATAQAAAQQTANG